MDALTLLYYAVRALTQSPESREVYLFGSTARELRTFVSDHTSEFTQSPTASDFSSNSNDFDLVVTVSPRIYDAWNQQLNDKLTCVADCDTPADDAYDGCKWTRFNLALKLLGCGAFENFSPLYGWLHTLDGIKELDLHLMPEDWRSRTAELQDHLPHHDPLFVSNIAQDAVQLTDHDTSQPYIWQENLLAKLARIQRARRDIGHAAVLSTVVSLGLTTTGAAPQS